MANELLSEGLIPMNFNWRSNTAPSSITLNNLVNGQDGMYNPMVNMNDPMVAHQIQKQREREALSQRKQQEAVYRDNANKVLYSCMTAVENLIRGNAHIGFSYDESLILLNSVRNKCFEILNQHSQLLDNDILLGQLEMFQNVYLAQYGVDVRRFNLEHSSNSISFNSEKGIVMFNPHGLYDIVCEWCNRHISHVKVGDQMIYG